MSKAQLRRGFALVDLLMVISVIAALGSVLPGTLSRIRGNAEATICVSNARQMMAAVTMYAGNFNNFFPPNEDNTGPQGHVWFVGHVSALPSATSSPFDPEVNLLAPFTADDHNVFKCPSDRSTAMDRRTPRVRSVAMNAAVGTVCASSPAAHIGPPVLAAHGPWLDGNHGHVRGTRFRTFAKESDYVDAAGTWVLGDEDPLSINDASLGTPGYSPANPGLSSIRWVDFPAAHHQFGGTFGWGDGHAGIKRWKSLRPQRGSLLSSFVTPAQRPDWEWLAQHATQPLR